MMMVMIMMMMMMTTMMMMMNDGADADADDDDAKNCWEFLCIFHDDHGIVLAGYHYGFTAWSEHHCVNQHGGTSAEDLVKVTPP